MWAEGISAAVHATPASTVVVALALVAIAGVIMYVAAKFDTTTAYESRRSIQLREAAKREGLHQRNGAGINGCCTRRIVYLGDDCHRK